MLIIGEHTANVQKASQIVDRILSSDKETRDRIRKEQLSVAAQLTNSKSGAASKTSGMTIDDVYRKEGIEAKVDDTMMTPYGPASAQAYIIQVPNDVVGLIIGKDGETIRQLQLESGAKIQVALKEVETTGLRNVFVEGSDEKYRKAKEMIDDIIRNNRQSSSVQGNASVGDSNPFLTNGNRHMWVFFDIPDKMVGLVIGKGTETLKNIALKSNTKIYIPQKNTQSNMHSPPRSGSLKRTVEILGAEPEQQIAKDLIQELIDSYNSGQMPKQI